MIKQFKRYCVDNCTHPQTDTTENNITFATLLLHGDTHSNITVRIESHDIQYSPKYTTQACCWLTRQHHGQNWITRHSVLLSTTVLLTDLQLPRSFVCVQMLDTGPSPGHRPFSWTQALLLDTGPCRGHTGRCPSVSSRCQCCPKQERSSSYMWQTGTQHRTVLIIVCYHLDNHYAQVLSIGGDGWEGVEKG